MKAPAIAALTFVAACTPLALLCNLAVKSEALDGYMTVAQANAAAHWQRYSDTYAVMQEALEVKGSGQVGFSGPYFDSDGSVYMMVIPGTYMITTYDACSGELPKCPPDEKNDDWIGKGASVL